MHEGIHFGSLLVGFRVTDFGSLWSPGLWAIACAKVTKVRRVLLAVLIVISIILGATVGSASAILMLPSLDWETQETSQTGNGFATKDVQIFSAGNESTLWPNHTTLADSHLSHCNSTYATVPPDCPLGAFSTILDVTSLDTLIFTG